MTDVLSLILVATFTLVAGLAIARARRGGPAGRPAAILFGSLALSLLVGEIEDVLGAEFPAVVSAARSLLLIAFPYLFLRFTACFRALPRYSEAAGRVLFACVAVATVAFTLPPDATASQARAGYVVLVLVYWVTLSAIPAVVLWRAGNGLPAVPRRRMRLMSVAISALAVALLVVAQLRDGAPAAGAIGVSVAIASGLAFALGLWPPRALRMSWRLPETRRVQQATMAMLRATTREEVARELLPATAAIVGAAGAALVDDEGVVVASHADAPAAGTIWRADTSTHRDDHAEVVPLGGGHGQLVFRTSPYTPFFAAEEVDLLKSMSAVGSLALERCELLSEERSRSAALDAARQEAVDAHDQARSADRAKSEFLSRMSHELRTPLNAILGFGQLLEMSSLDEEDRDAVDHVLKAGRHLLALINDVLDLSRIEAGMLTISLEPVHARELIDDAVGLIGPLATARSITVDTSDIHCDAYVQTDRQRCRQVLLNLLSNAVKYNRDGGEVEVSCEPRADILRVCVRDSGAGIDPARRDKLFEPFERLGAESSAVEGTGLGLALTKQLVERLGGAIGLDSTPGVGSTFWIDLPMTQPPTAGGPAPSRPAEPIGAPRRTLLLVEDNLTNLHLVEAMLRQRPGIEVLPAMQGRMAVDLAHEHQPDAIVLDLHLPDVPGREILHRLRADPQTRDIPIVIASADASARRVEQLLDDGAFAFVSKPLDLREFLDAVDRAIAARTAAGNSAEATDSQL